MTDYGVQPTGFVRKSLATILAEIEAQMVTEFGPDVVQTADSPLGQINGIFSEASSKAWELDEDIYQSLDPDQAEGLRLDILGRVRSISRASGQSDSSFRQTITNEGQARVDLQDISRAIAALDGVTYSHIWVNDGFETDENGMPPGSICIAVTGGEGDEIAGAIRKYIVPGSTLYGSDVIESVVDGYGRAFRILRPIDVPVTLAVFVETFKDNRGNPPPSSTAIQSTLLENYDPLNGVDVDAYGIRSVIEAAFTTVKVTRISGSRDGLAALEVVDIGFIEKASLASVTVTVI